MTKILKFITASTILLSVIGCKAEVANIELTGITVTPPAKTAYNIDEELNIDGMKVTAVYSDESTKNVTEKASVGAFDSSTAGTKTIVVSYTEDIITVNTSFEVTVSENPPVTANVTNLTAKCTTSQTVKLTWTNPTDEDFAKVVITYDPDGKVEVLKTAEPNNEATVTGLTNDTEYTFTVKAYDNAGNASSGVSVKCKLGKSYTPATNSNGGLEGFTNQKQGQIVKETWMTDNGNLKIGETEISKTSEVVIIPTGTMFEIYMKDDTSWSTDIDDSAYDSQKGVFLKDRKVKLSQFVMSQYEVTEQLWAAVMGEEQTMSIKPKSSINWYQAITFCNKLTLLTGGTVDDLVYEVSGVDFTSESISIPEDDDATWDEAVCHIERTGYRLPTEAEWEFAAHGGDPNVEAWTYAFSGIDCDEFVVNEEKSNKSPKYDQDGWIVEDENLMTVAVYSYNSNGSKANVGTKNANALKLYDLSGNVQEWCWDWYGDPVDSNDDIYINTSSGYIENPLGDVKSASELRCVRGGSYIEDSIACYCTVTNRDCFSPEEKNEEIGLRVCRTTK